MGGECGTCPAAHDDGGHHHAHFADHRDAYQIGDDGRVELAEVRQGHPLVVNLDDSYKLVDAIESLGTPSMVGCVELKIEGPLRFADGVTLYGKVAFSSPAGEIRTVAPGTYVDGEFTL